MIVSDIKNLQSFKCISKNLVTAIDFLASADFSALEEGRREIAGDDVYMVVSSYQTREHDVSKYETHDRYIDIQCLAEGEEIIFWNERDTMQTSVVYDAEKDKTNYKDAPGTASILLKPGAVAVFFPEDAHKACCKVGNESLPVRKVLLKVKLA